METDWRRGRLTVRATIDGATVYEETTRFPSVGDGDAITSRAGDGRLAVRLPVPRGGDGPAGRRGRRAD